jgi:hypothetical protein
MVTGLIKATVYVQIQKNQLDMKHIEEDKSTSLTAFPSFSTQRMLIGEYSVAEHLFKKGVKELIGSVWIPPNFRIVMQPMELIEGGLCQVEERILHQLAASMQPRTIKVHLGDALGNEDVLTLCEIS